MGFGSTATPKQTVSPPLKGVFPLDHDSACKTVMREYLSCLKEHRSEHGRCSELSAKYLTCRMDRELMERQDLGDLGLGEEARKESGVGRGRKENREGVKEVQGFVAGKHIKERRKGWFW